MSKNTAFTVLGIVLGSVSTCYLNGFNINFWVFLLIALGVLFLVGFVARGTKND